MSILETKNFYLRQVTLEDVTAYSKFWSDTEVMKYIGDGTWSGGPDKVEGFLRSNLQSYSLHPHLGFWGVVDKVTHELVGDAGLSPVLETGEVEVGYLLRRDYWGKGYGTELLAGLIEYGFKKLQLETIIAVTHPENLGSIHLLKKCKMSPAGTGFYHNRFSLKFSLSRKDSENL